MTNGDADNTGGARRRSRDGLIAATVRVLTEHTSGTGVFVAPGLVVTCASLIPIETSKIEIVHSGTVYPAEILIREPADAHTALYSYPDVALLRIDLTHHPLVTLNTEAPEPGRELYAYGCLSINDQPFWDHMTLISEGERVLVDTAHRFLKAKGGQVQPGASGTGVVDMLTGELVGMIKLTRNAQLDLGLIMTPTATIVATLADAGYAILEPEQPTVDAAPTPSQPVATESVAPTITPATTTSDVATDVSWATDSPGNIDLLKRTALATVLADRLQDARDRDSGTSLLIHLDGPWGSGKSTLLRLLESQLQSRDDELLVVWFDAWQQSRMSPPWWALLSTARGEITRDQAWWRRRWFRTHETYARVRRSGAAYLLALVVLAVIAAALGAAIFSLAGTHKPWMEIAKLIGSAVTALTTLWAGATLAGRLLLWDSARGARLFEQADNNPMREVADHFDWLLRQSRRPLVFFIDDLDRCADSYVVELLDSIQTLIRNDPRRSTRRHMTTPAAFFVVAADGAWLRQSYENQHAHFRSCIDSAGSSLGHLFLSKLFQLRVPMPGISATAQARFLRNLLGMKSLDGDPDASDAKAAIQAATGDEQAILGTMKSLAPTIRDIVAGDAARALAAVETQSQTEHALRKFAPLLSPNPRSMKLFLNTYSILRAVRTLEGILVSTETLALWTIIQVRWPAIASILHRDPNAIIGIREPLWWSDHFPAELDRTVVDPDLQRVVNYPDGGPLTADSVRLCCGMADSV